jgi:hypothetical protein
MNGTTYRERINAGLFSISIKGCNVNKGKILIIDAATANQSPVVDTVFTSAS